MRFLKVIWALFLVMVLAPDFLCSQNLDDHRSNLIKNNSSFSANVLMEITAGNNTRSLKGTAIIDETFSYLKLEQTEFFSFKDYTIKVANEEKKIGWSTAVFNSFQDMLFNPDDVSNIYFEPEIETIDNGEIIFTLKPIESMRKALGVNKIVTDKDYNLLRTHTIMPSSNSYGIDEITVFYSSRSPKINSKLNPLNFFKIDGSNLIILSKYNNYTILNI